MSNPQVPISGSIGSAGPFPTLGATSIALTGSPHTLLDPSETCYLYIILTGTAAPVIAPLIKGFTFVVVNESSGSVVFGGSSGTTVTIPISTNGSGTLVSTDGTNYAIAGGLPNPFNVPATAGAVNSSGTSPVPWGLLSLTTTNNTPTPFAGISIPAGATEKFSITVVGQSAAGAYYTADLFLVANRVASAGPTINPVTPEPANVLVDAGNVGVACSVAATISGNNLIVTPTGLAATSMDWTCLWQGQVVV